MCSYLRNTPQSTALSHNSAVHGIQTAECVRMSNTPSCARQNDGSEDPTVVMGSVSRTKKNKRTLLKLFDILSRRDSKNRKVTDKEPETTAPLPGDLLASSTLELTANEDELSPATRDEITKLRALTQPSLHESLALFLLQMGEGDLQAAARIYQGQQSCSQKLPSDEDAKTKAAERAPSLSRHPSMRRMVTESGAEPVAVAARNGGSVDATTSHTSGIPKSHSSYFSNSPSAHEQGLLPRCERFGEVPTLFPCDIDVGMGAWRMEVSTVADSHPVNSSSAMSSSDASRSEGYNAHTPGATEPGAFRVPGSRQSSDFELAFELQVAEGYARNAKKASLMHDGLLRAQSQQESPLGDLLTRVVAASLAAEEAAQVACAASTEASKAVEKVGVALRALQLEYCHQAYQKQEENHLAALTEGIQAMEDYLAKAKILASSLKDKRGPTSTNSPVAEDESEGGGIGQDSAASDGTWSGRVDERRFVRCSSNDTLADAVAATNIFMRRPERPLYPKSQLAGQWTALPVPQNPRHSYY